MKKTLSLFLTALLLFLWLPVTASAKGLDAAGEAYETIMETCGADEADNLSGSETDSQGGTDARDAYETDNPDRNEQIGRDEREPGIPEEADNSAGEDGGVDRCEERDSINEEEQANPEARDAVDTNGLSIVETELEQELAELADLVELVVLDEEEPSEDAVHDAGQLATWCEDHKNSGGWVTLGADITLTQQLTLYNVTGRIIIDTGSYGLVYDGGSIDIDSVEITGEGVNVPVLDIYDAGGSWNSAVQTLRITATVREGIGGVALRVRAYDGYDDFDTLSVVKEGQILSYGDGAVGLYLDAAMSVYCLNIAVEGDNSIAVYVDLDASLYYCKLSADGREAVSAACGSTFGSVVLDACSVSPNAEDAQVINRKITDIIGRNFYWPVKQYEDIEYDNAFQFYLSGFGFAWVDLLLDLDGALDTIDTGVLGRTVVQASLYPSFQGLGLEDDFPLEIIVDVRDPAAPCITNMQFVMAGSNETYVALEFWDSYDPADENVMLWRSDDSGESWYDFTDSSNIEWRGDCLYFYYGEITDDILLQLEYLGSGESNIVRLYSVDGNVFGGFDGDRDGGDRIIPPWAGSTNPPEESGNARQPFTRGGGNNGESNRNDLSAPLDAIEGGADLILKASAPLNTVEGGANLILEASIPLVQPEMMAPATVDLDLDLTSAPPLAFAAFLYPYAGSAEQASESNAIQPVSAFPFVPVAAAGFLSIGGAGGLVWLRRKRVFSTHEANGK